MVTIDHLKDDYFLRGIDPDFAIGRRANLRYAVESAYACRTQLNPKGPEPFEYLEYAKADISAGTRRGALNALGNAKRAVHLTIDNFLSIMVLGRAYASANFPAKLELLENLEAFPTQALDNLNRARNLVEHEYVDVTIDEIGNFVEICEMFLLIAYPYLKHVVIGALVGIEGDSRCFEWFLGPAQGDIQIYEVETCPFIDTSIGRIYHSVGSEDNRVQVQTVHITRGNAEEWLPYLDLFVYCTRKAATQLPRPNSRGHGTFVYTCDRNYLPVS